MEAEIFLSRALERVPRLTYQGIGLFREAKLRRERGDALVEQEIVRLRKLLRKRLDEIAVAADQSMVHGQGY
jgi:hypothetical protein